MAYAGFRRQASRVPPQGGVFPLTIPFKGWNTRDHLAKLDPVYAPKLDNLYAEDGRLTLRNGYEEHVTTLGGTVESLFAFSAGATQELFAAADGRIWDVTTTRSSVSTGHSSNRWDDTMFAAGGAQYLVIANGADAVRNYNGSSWTTPTINNVSSSDLKGVASHKNRLWFIEDGTTSAWYLPVNAIAGDASELDFGALCKKGGELAAIDTWTRDGGDGLDDLLAVITSEGEVLVYQGTDPASASTWSLVGIYSIPAPLGGTRCTVKAGADLYILTRTGLISLDAIMQGYPAVPSISGAIEPSFVDQARQYADSLVWDTLWDRQANRLIVNVPNVESEPTQFVYSLQSAAWTRLIGQPARCWAEFDGGVYFGSQDATVYQADTGTSDDGDPITGEVVFSPSEYGVPGIKHWRRARVHFFSAASVVPTVQMMSDYATISGSLAASTTLSPGTGAVWDVDDWDVALWAGAATAQSLIVTLNGRGFTGALRVAVKSADEGVQITGAEINAEVGRVL